MKHFQLCIQITEAPAGIDSESQSLVGPRLRESTFFCSWHLFENVRIILVTNILYYQCYEYGDDINNSND